MNELIYGAAHPAHEQDHMGTGSAAAAAAKGSNHSAAQRPQVLPPPRPDGGRDSASNSRKKCQPSEPVIVSSARPESALGEMAPHFHRLARRSNGWADEAKKVHQRAARRRDELAARLQQHFTERMTAAVNSAVPILANMFANAVADSMESAMELANINHQWAGHQSAAFDLLAESIEAMGVTGDVRNPGPGVSSGRTPRR